MSKLKDYCFIYEELSKSNKKKLDDMIANGTINNENIDTINNILQKHAKLAKLNTVEYRDKAKAFFKKHGLLQYKWGRNTDAIGVFNDIFKDKPEILEKIIDGDGILSFNDMPKEGNLFSLCKGFQDEAKSIATLKISGSANSGPCEILLKLILNEGTTNPSGGDVSLGDLGELEVKCVTRSEGKKGISGLSGGHAAGQKTKDKTKENNTSIRMAWSIYNYVYNNLFGLEWTEANKMANNKEYAFLQNNTSYTNFCKNYVEPNKPGVKKFAKVLVEALMWQYNFLEQNGKDNGRTNLVDKEKLLADTERELSKIYKNGKMDPDKQRLLDIVGSIQLYLYSVTEEFSHIIFIYYDHNDISRNELNYDEDPELVKGSGYYVLLDRAKLLDLSNTIDNITFGVLDGVNSTQGRTGKMYFKYLYTKLK